MKKVFSMVLVLVLAFSVLTLGISAQAENKLTTSWEKGLAGAVEQKTDADGTTYASATGISGAWVSPFLNVYDAVKAVVGNEEEAEVMFAFEIRVQYKNAEDQGTPVTVRPVIRANECADDMKNSESFLEIYEGEMFSNKDNANVLAYFDISSLEVIDEWTVFESAKFVSSTELNDTWWKRWDLCVDQISDVDMIASLEFRNAGIYNAEDYESMIPEPTEEPTTPAPPTEIPTPTQQANTPVGLAPTATATQDSTNDEGQQNDGNNTTTIVIVCVVAVIVIAAIVIGVVVAKKKKAGEDTGENSENTEE